MGDREESRIGFTYTVGLLKIKSRLEQGEEIRNDGFFESDELNRSAGEEILEGVLRSAQIEYQEKKLPYYGNLLANIAFDFSVSRDKANLFLKMAQSLTYQQLCILQLLSEKGKLSLKWNWNFMHLDELQKYGSLEPATAELGNFKLLHLGCHNPPGLDYISSVKLGLELTKLMGLNEIDKNEIYSLEDEFSVVKEIIKRNNMA